MIDTNESWQRKVDIFRGQCFNNASMLISKHEETVVLDHIFELAQKLFDDGMERGWIKRIVDTRKLDSTGTVRSQSFPYPSGIKVDMTEKEGREMDKESVVI